MNQTLIERDDLVAVGSVLRNRPDPIRLALPAALGFILFLVAPLAAFFVYSFLTAKLFAVSAPFTLDAYGRALGSGLNGVLAANSIIIGLLGAAASVAIALPVAYWLRYSAGRWQMPCIFIITGSMFASYLVRIYAWRTILGTNGVFNQGLEGLGLIDEPVGFLLYNRFSVTLALVHIFLPYVVLVLYAGFRPLSPALLESAQDLGANAWNRWRRVILPLIAAPAATSFLFVFILSAADYVTPQLIGGTSGQMLGVQIQANFKAIGDWPQGAAVSILMLLAFVVCYGLTMLGLRLRRLDKIQWIN
jgi:spermidine/putrescine transport system permease protein